MNWILGLLNVALRGLHYVQGLGRYADNPPTDVEWISTNRANGHRLGCYCQHCIQGAANRAENRRLLAKA